VEANKRINVFLTVAGLAPEFGGPSQSVPALAEALASENADVELISCESRPTQSAPALPNRDLVRTRLLATRHRQSRWRARGNDFFRALIEDARLKDTVIHDNGLWLPSNHAVAGAARFLQRPLIISPRGMLSRWERKHHAWKKKLAWILFQQSDLFGAAALHATSEQEAADFRDVGCRAPIAIVPNGIELPLATESEARTAKGEKRTALCVTRIHPKKGLMDLIEAWSEARPIGWRMIIAGMDEDRHLEKLKAESRKLKVETEFEFVGPVGTEQKQALYNKADLFILPSHSENFGMSIAEALAHGLPVITTRGTPWRDLSEDRCGWWVDIGPVSLAQALVEATKMDDHARREMGKRGRGLVERKYSWSRVAREMKSVYAWLLGQTDRPACVL
jgi:glycosyltransferase involved in cell wall biosynthesis